MGAGGDSRVQAVCPHGTGGFSGGVTPLRVHRLCSYAVESGPRESCSCARWGIGKGGGTSAPNERLMCIPGHRLGCPGDERVQTSILFCMVLDILPQLCQHHRGKSRVPDGGVDLGCRMPSPPVHPFPEVTLLPRWCCGGRDASLMLIVSMVPS